MFFDIAACEELKVPSHSRKWLQETVPDETEVQEDPWITEIARHDIEPFAFIDAPATDTQVILMTSASS